MEDDVIEIKGTLYSTRVTTFNEYVGFLNLVKQDEIVSQEWDKFRRDSRIIKTGWRRNEEVLHHVFTSYYKTARVTTRNVEEGNGFNCLTSHQSDFAEIRTPNVEVAKGKEKMEHFGIELEDTSYEFDNISPIHPSIKRRQTMSKDNQGVIKGPIKLESEVKEDSNSSSRTNEEQRNTNEGWKLANISAAEMSDLETLLKQKTFTRYEIERLTRLGDGDKANISNDSHVLRLKASKSGPLNKHAEERENFHAVISTPRAFEEDVPSPILLAKPRSRRTTAMYRMARSPYYRGRSTLSKKPTPSLIYSQPTWELEGSNGSKMPSKSRSSILDDLGSGGPMRRTRQKTPSLTSSQHAWELEGSNRSKM
ncbi:hypothetical protein Tco_0660785, partial [Tanacetum coccineum]